jgi:poly-beta-hydroxyalkanoate depolymerase
MKCAASLLRIASFQRAIGAQPMPQWVTPNRVDLELDTMRLRNFGRHGSGGVSTPVVIDSPYAGHSSTLADYAKGQSLVETLRATGHDRIYVMDWKGATPGMKDFDIDTYLAEINVVVDDLLPPARRTTSRPGKREQVFAAEYLVGTPRTAIVKKKTPGGHIGLFMGSRTLADAWPAIGHWMKSHEPS